MAQANPQDEERLVRRSEGPAGPALPIDAYDLDSFVRAYLEAALWIETDEQGRELDARFDVEDFSQEALAHAQRTCDAFRRSAGALLDGIEDSQAGHDLWLTMGHHGAGFWDRDLGQVGDQLTELAHRMGEPFLYAGDDGLLYFDGGHAANPQDEERLARRSGLPDGDVVVRSLGQTRRFSGLVYVSADADQRLVVGQAGGHEWLAGQKAWFSSSLPGFGVGGVTGVTGRGPAGRGPALDILVEALPGRKIALRSDDGATSQRQLAIIGSEPLGSRPNPQDEERLARRTGPPAVDFGVEMDGPGARGVRVPGVARIHADVADGVSRLVVRDVPLRLDLWIMPAFRARAVGGRGLMVRPSPKPSRVHGTVALEGHGNLVRVQTDDHEAYLPAVELVPVPFGTSWNPQDEERLARRAGRALEPAGSVHFVGQYLWRGCKAAIMPGACTTVNADAATCERCRQVAEVLNHAQCWRCHKWGPDDMDWDGDPVHRACENGGVLENPQDEERLARRRAGRAPEPAGPVHFVGRYQSGCAAAGKTGARTTDDPGRITCRRCDWVAQALIDGHCWRCGSDSPLPDDLDSDGDPVHRACEDREVGTAEENPQDEERLARRSGQQASMRLALADGDHSVTEVWIDRAHRYAASSRAGEDGTLKVVVDGDEKGARRAEKWAAVHAPEGRLVEAWAWDVAPGGGSVGWQFKFAARKVSVAANVSMGGVRMTCTGADGGKLHADVVEALLRLDEPWPHSPSVLPKGNPQDEERLARRTTLASRGTMTCRVSPGGPALDVVRVDALLRPRPVGEPARIQDGMAVAEARWSTHVADVVLADGRVLPLTIGPGAAGQPAPAWAADDAMDVAYLTVGGRVGTTFVCHAEPGKALAFVGSPQPRNVAPPDTVQLRPSSRASPVGLEAACWWGTDGDYWTFGRGVILAGLDPAEWRREAGLGAWPAGAEPNPQDEERLARRSVRQDDLFARLVGEVGMAPDVAMDVVRELGQVRTESDLLLDPRGPEETMWRVAHATGWRLAATSSIRSAGRVRGGYLYLERPSSKARTLCWNLDQARPEIRSAREVHEEDEASGNPQDEERLAMRRPAEPTSPDPPGEVLYRRFRDELGLSEHAAWTSAATLTEADEYGYGPEEAMETAAALTGWSLDAFDAQDRDGRPLYLYLSRGNQWHLPTICWSFDRSRPEIRTTRQMADEADRTGPAENPQDEERLARRSSDPQPTLSVSWWSDPAGVPVKVWGARPVMAGSLNVASPLLVSSREALSDGVQVSLPHAVQRDLFVREPADPGPYAVFVPRHQLRLASSREGEALAVLLPDGTELFRASALTVIGTNLGAVLIEGTREAQAVWIRHDGMLLRPDVRAGGAPGHPTPGSHATVVVRTATGNPQDEERLARRSGATAGPDRLARIRDALRRRILRREAVFLASMLGDPAARQYAPGMREVDWTDPGVREELVLDVEDVVPDPAGVAVAFAVDVASRVATLVHGHALVRAVRQAALDWLRSRAPGAARAANAAGEAVRTGDPTDAARAWVCVAEAIVNGAGRGDMDVALSMAAAACTRAQNAAAWQGREDLELDDPDVQARRQAEYDWQRARLASYLLGEIAPPAPEAR